MKTIWTIYSAKIDNKFYIGITSKGLDWRKRRHQVEARRGLTKTVFHNKLAKNIDTTEWTVLKEVIIKDEALLLEKQLIIQYNAKFPNGYNLTDGGDGIWGHKHSKEAKENISKKNTGHIASLESRKLMSKNRKGISTGVQTIEQKNEHAKRSGTLPFDVYTRTGEYVGTWCNKSECSRSLNISRTSIINGLLTEQPYYNVKYIFRIKDAPL